jgi:hypothetical protein
MTQEEKAKRYDEAINIAKRIFSEKEACNLFRELKESKDERIRKYLFYQLLDNPPKDVNEHHLYLEDVIYWVKKQGELAIFLSKIQQNDSVTREKDGTLVNITEQARAALSGGKEINHTIRERNKSKDRRIRKYLRNLLMRNPPKDILGLSDVIAWLKKQDELAIFLSQIKVGDMVTRNEVGVIVNLSQLDRMNKSANKKEAKKNGQNN